MGTGGGGNNMGTGGGNNMGTGGNNMGTGSTDPEPRSVDNPAEHWHSVRSLYKSGTVTRSGRHVKLSMKVQEADM